MGVIVLDMKNCSLCPRECKADRTVSKGYCGATDKIKIARASLHFWEEPCISGKNGSGTVFFSGCPLKCCFCQNYKISDEAFGKEISEERLSEIFLELQEKGANNINLVTASPYVPMIIKSLDMIKSELKIPILYNSGGYEKVETLRMLEGYIDIYLPDMKYMDSVIAGKYSSAEDYPDVNKKALDEMFSQVGAPIFDDNGIMKKGMIIRHLTLPNNFRDTEKVLRYIAKHFPEKEVLISLMSQYTPCHKAFLYKEISRKISTLEYNKALDLALDLGLTGFMQERSSAKEEYTPPFDLTGI
ncbi:MAG: radical SAM protein [Oscillospiraceae bacterium]|nr:radical SAM protein [Oscillospiraceae bacterium]